MMPMMSWLSPMTWLVLAALLLVVALVAIAVAVDRKGSAQPGSVPELRARYARGEIDDDEYQTRLALLRSLKGARR
jgi:uncharacterized membrane protein